MEPAPPEEAAGNGISEIHATLRKVERRDWWLWVSAIVVILLLTVAVFSLSVPVIFRETDWFMKFHLSQALRGLLGMVLLFNVYAIYQQVLIKRLRRQMAEQMEAMAHLEIRAEEYQKLSVLDPLTGLYNRRYAEKHLETEMARARRQGHPLTLVILDLNNFKEANDRYGHAAGDLVLQSFAERLKKTSRGSDLAVRLGGDEFLMVLPESRPEQLEHLLERLRGLEVEFRGEAIPVEFSVGWAGYEPGESPQELLERADQALYAEKRAQGVRR